MAIAPGVEQHRGRRLAAQGERLRLGLQLSSRKVQVCWGGGLRGRGERREESVVLGQLKGQRGLRRGRGARSRSKGGTVC